MIDCTPAAPEDFDEIRVEVRRLYDKYGNEYWRGLEPDRYPTDFVKELTDQGWLGSLIPEEYGGGGLSLAGAAVILEEISASGGNPSACHAQMYVMGTVLRHGSESKSSSAPGCRRSQTSPGLRCHRTLQVQRPRRSDSRRARRRHLAHQRPEDLDQPGRALRPNGAARPHDPADEVTNRMEGLSVFLVEMRDDAGELIPGLTINPIKTMMNHNSTEVFFDDVVIPATALIGTEGMGFRHILDGMNAERILIAAECIGDGRFFLDKASTYANEREVFGRPIGMNPSRVPACEGVRQPRGCEPDAMEGRQPVRRWRVVRR